MKEREKIQLKKDIADIVDQAYDDIGWGRIVKKTIIIQRFNNLNSKNKKILSLRFGIYGGITHTQKELAEEFGVTIERIRQIENKAIDKLFYDE